MQSELKFVQAWDIETTGQRLQGADKMFAVGSATLEVDMSTGAVRQVASGRWVLEINPNASKPWAHVWAEGGYDQRCWTEFWSKHADILDKLMKDTPAGRRFNDDAAMAASIAEHIAWTEKAFGDGIVRVYDTIGFDVTEIGNLLERHGHPSIFLVRKGWPCATSYLDDVRRAALDIDPLGTTTAAQRELRRQHDAAALPAGLSHTHDPADDAASIAWKWVHYRGIVAAKLASPVRN